MNKEQEHSLLVAFADRALLLLVAGLGGAWFIYKSLIVKGSQVLLINWPEADAFFGGRLWIEFG